MPVTWPWADTRGRSGARRARYEKEVIGAMVLDDERLSEKQDVKGSAGEVALKARGDLHDVPTKTPLNRVQDHALYPS